MPTVDLKHGMFGWTDLMMKDPDSAKAFYAGTMFKALPQG